MIDITPEQEATLREMYDADAPHEMIRNALGVGWKVYSAWRIQLQLPHRPPVKGNGHGHYEGMENYWKSLPKNADAAFRAAIGDRCFKDDPRACRPESRRIVTRAYPVEAERWESTAAWA